MSIKRRLERLEGRRREGVPGDFGSLFGKALMFLSDEDLEALEEVIEQDAGPADEGVDFGRVYEAADVRGRQALEVLFAEMEALKKGDRWWG